MGLANGTQPFLCGAQDIVPSESWTHQVVPLGTGGNVSAWMISSPCNLDFLGWVINNWFFDEDLRDISPHLDLDSYFPGYFPLKDSGRQWLRLCQAGRFCPVSSL